MSMKHTLYKTASPDRPRSYQEYKKSAAIYKQRQQEDAERRQKVNPRLVFSDPDVYFSDSQLEQLETP